MLKSYTRTAGYQGKQLTSWFRCLLNHLLLSKPGQIHKRWLRGGRTASSNPLWRRRREPCTPWRPRGPRPTSWQSQAPDPERVSPGKGHFPGYTTTSRWNPILSSSFFSQDLLCQWLQYVVIHQIGVKVFVTFDIKSFHYCTLQFFDQNKFIF